MSEPRVLSPESFLRALGRQLSALSLYGPDHRGLERGLGEAFALLHEFGAGDPVVFDVSPEGVSANGEPLVGMSTWPWIGRLRERGIERLTFHPDGGEAQFRESIRTLCRDLGLEPPDRQPAGAGQTGPVAEPTRDSATDSGSAEDMLKELEAGMAEGRPARALAEPPPGRGSERVLDETGDVLQWIHTEAVRNGALPRSEVVRVAGTVRSVIEAEDAPQATPRELAPGYTTVHGLNVALLAVAFAERLEFEEGAVAAVAGAALLHDLGRALIDLEVAAPGSWTATARSEMMLHPARGARLLLSAGPEHAVAAVVAYEHHMPWSGEGYPTQHFARRTHRFTRMIRICDVYDTLRTPRPFRPAWTREAAIQLLQSQAGTTFDPELVTAFVGLCSERRVRIPTHGPEEQGPEQLSLIPEGVFDADLEQAPTLL